jgi:hypothetical protein
VLRLEHIEYVPNENKTCPGVAGWRACMFMSVCEGVTGCRNMVAVFMR